MMLSSKASAPPAVWTVPHRLRRGHICPKFGSQFAVFARLGGDLGPHVVGRDLPVPQ